MLTENGRISRKRTGAPKLFRRIVCHKMGWLTRREKAFFAEFFHPVVFVLLLLYEIGKTGYAFLVL
jgi:hypothetical protein